jgi:single-stranded DNA-binding protein
MVQPDENSIYLTGELAADPQHRELPSGLPVANVKLSVTSRFLSTSAVAAVTTVNLTFYGPFVELARPLTAKTRVYVHGELVIRSTSATATRNTTEVVVRALHELKNVPNLQTQEAKLGKQAPVSQESDPNDPANWG